jgi:hypothetical protein
MSIVSDTLPREIILPTAVVESRVLYCTTKQDSSVGIETGYGLDSRGSILGSVSTASKFTETLIQWVLKAVSRGVKRPGCEPDPSHPSSAEIMNGGAVPPLPRVFTA